MAKGPGLDYNTLSDLPRTMSFRIITAYYFPTDCFITRIDTKIDGNHHTVGIFSTPPIEPTDGDKIMQNDDLIAPKSGIEYCQNLKISKPELIRALKELINDLEND